MYKFACFFHCRRNAVIEVAKQEKSELADLHAKGISLYQ